MSRRPPFAGRAKYRGRGSGTATALATVAVAFLLSACGARDEGPEWFPLRAGSVQKYLVTFEGEESMADQVWTETVLESSMLESQRVSVRRHSEGVDFYLISDEQGVRRVAQRPFVEDEPTRDDKPLWVVKAPFEVGTEWTTVTVPYLILRTNEYPRELRYSHTALMNWRIEAVDDKVDTPAGHFEPCLRVLGRASVNLYANPTVGFADIPLISREWYCQGVGLVRWEREEQVPPGFMTGGVMRAELLP